MKISYEYQEEYKTIIKTSIYNFIELPSAYKFNANLVEFAHAYSSSKGVKISVDISGFPSGYEYALGLYEIAVDIKYIKVYRYERGSWWSRNVYEETSESKEKVILGYVAVPIRIGQTSDLNNYFYEHSGLGRKLGI